MMTATRLLFRITYTTLYAFLYLLLAALLLVTPGDIIRQALASEPRQLITILIIAIVYVFTVLVVLFVYTLRLYVTRTVLASIPKIWVPIEKGDVPKSVRKVIVASLARSAAIAWHSRPRIASNPQEPIASNRSSQDVALKGKETTGKQDAKIVPRRRLRLRKPATIEDKMGIALPPTKAVWGEIEHHGWGSPNSPDLPDLQYATVLSELPNLVEAKAVSQAPQDRTSTTDLPTLDPEAVALLQRATNMTMRDYILHLIGLGILVSSATISEFLDIYERARFSTRPMSNAAFRRLLHLFAELLRDMRSLDPAVFGTLNDGNDNYSEYEEDIDDDAPKDSCPTSPSNRSSSPSPSVSTTGSRLRVQKPSTTRRSNPLQRDSSANTRHLYRTAPTTPKSKAEISGKANSVSRSSSFTRSLSSASVNNFAQTRQPYESSQPSSNSLRSTSQGSVIRLARNDEVEDLPYVLGLTKSR